MTEGLLPFNRGGVIVFPLWIPLLLLAMPTALLCRLDRRCIPPGHCQSCGYNLTGNTSGICPECGHHLDCSAGRPQDPPFT